MFIILLIVSVVLFVSSTLIINSYKRDCDKRIDENWKFIDKMREDLWNKRQQRIDNHIKELKEKQKDEELIKDNNDIDKEKDNK